jgi:D-alanine-D-alanine ligase
VEVGAQPGARRELLEVLERGICEKGPELALFLTYDRPERITERPALERLSFVERCVPDSQLDAMRAAFASIDVHVELFEGDLPLLKALADGRIAAVDRRLKIVYNGLEGGITRGGFEPGRLALVPAVVDSYGLLCANSDAHACTLGRHKFQYFTLLRALGLPAPQVWNYRLDQRWALGAAPSPGKRVIVKSTYESWSVGVTDDSVFIVDASSEERIRAVAEELGQPVVVQEFVSGHEVCVPVLSCPLPEVMPAVEIHRAKAPNELDAVTTIDDNLRRDGVVHRPYNCDSALEKQMRVAALGAFEALQLSSFGRVDFRIDGAGKAWITDVATSPGISDRSSAFSSVALLGFHYPNFLRVVIAASLAARGHL